MEVQLGRAGLGTPIRPVYRKLTTQCWRAGRRGAGQVASPGHPTPDPSPRREVVGELSSRPPIAPSLNIYKTSVPGSSGEILPTGM